MSILVLLIAAVFIVIVLRVLWICVVTYVGLQTAAIGTAQCDGGGLERERTNWQIAYNNGLGLLFGAPDDPLAQDTTTVLSRALAALKDWYGRADKFIVVYTTLLVIACVLALGLNVSPFADVAEFASYNKMQAKALEPSRGTIVDLPHVWPWAYGWSPVGGNKRDLAWFQEMPRAPTTAWQGENEWWARKLTWGLQLAYVVWWALTQCIGVAVRGYWYVILLIREWAGDALASNFPLMNLMLVVGIFALYRVHMLVTVNTTSTSTQTADSPASAKLLAAVGEYEGRLCAASSLLYKMLAPLYAAAKAKAATKTDPGFAAFKAFLVDHASTTDTANATAHATATSAADAAIALGWLNALQMTLQMSDDEVSLELDAALAAWMGLGATEAGAPTTDANRATVAALMGLMVFDPEWLSSMRVTQPLLYGSLAALRDFHELEARSSAFFRSRAIWSVAILDRKSVV